MNTIVTQHNVAQLGAIKRLSAAAALTAGGTGDNTAVTGATIDRMGFGGSMPNSLALCIAFEATLAATKTLSISYTVEDSADGTNWATYQTATAAVVATGPTGGGTVNGELEIAVDLQSARRFVRVNHTPDLNAANTDTAATRAVGFFAGFDRLAA